MRKLKLGILGVSSHFISRILLPLKQSDKIEVYAVASRDEEKAKKTANKWGIKKYYGSYEDLLNDKDIEAVYIPLPNHLHLEWIKSCIDAKKHVICEKPLTLNSEEAQVLIDYASGKDIKVMEAFMYGYHPKWQRAREIVAYGEIGTVTAIHTVFSYNNQDPNNIRNIKEYGGGALMDIGCYAISSSRFILNRNPIRVMSLIEKHSEFGTDIISSAILDYDKIRCLFTVSTSSYPQQEVKIFGTSGAITVTVPFNDHYDVRGELLVQNALGTRSVTFEPVNQYRLQFEAFAESIFKDAPAAVSLKDSLENMKIIDALKESDKTNSWVDIQVKN